MEQLDRRLFLKGLMLTSAGLIVPRRVISIPRMAALETFWMHGQHGQVVAVYGTRVGNTITITDLGDIGAGPWRLRL